MLGDKNSFYENGYETLGVYDEHLKFKEYFGKIFFNMIPNLKKFINKEDESLFHLDENNYLWSFNFAEGIVDCRIFNKEHVIGKSHILEQNINYINSDPYKNFLQYFQTFKKY